MIDRDPVTQAVIALLATLTGKPVGERTVPLDPETGEPISPPYTLVDPLDHVSDDNTLADRHTTAVSDYQATFVSGRTPGVPSSKGGGRQSQWLADRGRKVVERPADGSPGYEHPLTIPGVGCYRREAREAGGTQNAEDAIITSVIRFRFFLEETGA
ncbi:hypothetical protein P1P75_11970 [Streptomyces sp. ID05-39B]|uniref:hypothetical protein n=1 Tax=Streptomyces sp. ID05-39B TaxID=3028664 RepID=UPI0029AA01CE|nr:hypothetical protein [Streptomyces sp. ID05-39B]MDX3527140.1 hypothetical protein [Streptomyces sp. ID05-39B]